LLGDKAMTKPRANPLDQHIGRKLRELRILAGMSQQDIATHLNLTFQQVQKYERGTNRMSAGALYELSRILHVPMNEFVEGYHDDGTSDACLPLQTGVQALVRNYAQISSPHLRHHLCGMVRACADLSHDHHAMRGANTTHITQ
jgi:transcriptional regulator with XRE-family HTH domain